MRLLSICPNPALDHTVVLGQIAEGEIVRSERARTTAGGKGLNVARAAAALGGDVSVATWLGGIGAEHFSALAREDGLAVDAVIAPGQTLRICPIIVNRNDGTVLSTSDPTPVVDQATWLAFLDLSRSKASRSNVVCVAGSFPFGATERAVELTEALASVVTPSAIWVDTSGDALGACVDAFSGINIKVNVAEATALSGSAVVDGDLSVKDSALQACRTLGTDRAGTTVVTAGAAGAAVLNRGELLWADAPLVETANPTASGDSFLAGFMLSGAGMLERLSGLQCGLAAGASNAEAWFPTVDPGAVLRYAPMIKPVSVPF